jgi:hypothetical protein
MTDTNSLSTASVTIKSLCRGFEHGCVCWVCIFRLQRSFIKQPPPGAEFIFDPPIVSAVSKST